MTENSEEAGWKICHIRGKGTRNWVTIHLNECEELHEKEKPKREY
jgi:hypothetical protein